MKYIKFVPSIVRVIAIIAIIAFFVPYCCVSCGDEVHDISLIDLVTDDDLAADFDAFDDEDSHVEVKPIVAILLASPIVVLAASFLVRKEVPKACINAFCAVVTLYFNSFLAGEIEKQCAVSGLEVRMKIANTIYILYGIALIIISLYLIYMESVSKKDVTTRYTSGLGTYPIKDNYRNTDESVATDRLFSPERTALNLPEWITSARSDTFWHYAKFIPSIIRVIAIIAIIAFFVSYCCVLCEDEVETISMLDMATGFDAFDEVHVSAEPIVAILLVSPIVVLAVSFLVRKGVQKSFINAACAVVTLCFNSYIAGSATGIEKLLSVGLSCIVKMKIANTIYILYGIALIIISLYSIYFESVSKKDVTTSYTSGSRTYPIKENYQNTDEPVATTRTSSSERAASNPPEWKTSTRTETSRDTDRTVVATGTSSIERHTNPPSDSDFTRAGDL